jgi:hypothetical protein
VISLENKRMPRHRGIRFMWRLFSASPLIRVFDDIGIDRTDVQMDRRV